MGLLLLDHTMILRSLIDLGNIQCLMSQFYITYRPVPTLYETVLDNLTHTAFIYVNEVHGRQLQIDVVLH